MYIYKSHTWLKIYLERCWVVFATGGCHQHQERTAAPHFFGPVSGREIGVITMTWI